MEGCEQSTDIFESVTFSFCIQKFSRPHIIGFVADLLFSILESEWIKKYPDSTDERGWKLYPERKSCRFKNIQICVEGVSII